MKSIINKAFEKVDRANFVLPEYKGEADLDIPLPIGFGQTISQPTTVRMMLKWLDARPGDKILDVGSGSGWSTALLSSIVGSTGKVYATEIIPELLKFGEENCRRLGIKNARFFLAGDVVGLPKLAPFDRILVSAAASELPMKLSDQLKVGGKLVIPIRSSVFEIKKPARRSYASSVAGGSETGLKSIEHQGFAFVPLIADPERKI